MGVAEASASEVRRLEALRRYRLLDTPAEAAFDGIARLAASICAAPVAIIGLVDERRQWCKACIGLYPVEQPRARSLCSHAILQAGPLVVCDTLLDERFRDNPLVTGRSRIRFYAGAPLVTPEGAAIGTLGVMDHRPRELQPHQVEALERLAAQVLALMDLRLQAVEAASSLEVALASLERAEEAFRSLFADAPLGVALVDAELAFRRVNPALCTLLHRSLEELHGSSAMELCHPDDASRVQDVFRSIFAGASRHSLDARYLGRDGQETWLSLTMTAVRGGLAERPACLVMAEDVTRRRWLAGEYRRLALTDSLTGIPNRRAGEDAIAREAARSRRFGLPLSFVLIDVDRFKALNDRSGHAAGDLALRGVAAALSGLVRSSDYVVRWGGDEFLAILGGVPLEGARVFAGRARAAVEELPPAADDALRLTISVGVSELQPAEAPALAIGRADEQLYCAKAAGRNRVR